MMKYWLACNMDKLEKALKKLSDKEKKAFKDILERLQQRQTIGLDIAKLKGHKDIFRVAKGDLRIIFRYAEDGEIKLLLLDRRSEKTYRRY